MKQTTLQAKDLRIGNLLYTDNSTNVFLDIVRVDSILYLSEDDGKINYNHDYWDWDLENVHPIPITEQWLIDFGLELLYGQCYKIVEDDYQELDDFICIQKKINYWSVYMHSDYKKVDIELSNIQYIHQLQNIYSALSGEELTIKK